MTRHTFTSGIHTEEKTLARCQNHWRTECVVTIKIIDGILICILFDAEPHIAFALKNTFYGFTWPKKAPIERLRWS